MATQPPPPSRTASVGPTNAGGMPQQPPPPPPPGGQGPNSQQNLNQIVLEYLSKKGYSRTEAMLRMESAAVDASGNPVPSSIHEMGGKKYGKAFSLTQSWIDNVLEIYKPELTRLLWPLFVYSFLQCVGEYFSKDAQEFFNTFREPFESEHEDDIRALSKISEPEHMQENEIAQLYRKNKYRLTLSNMAFQTLIAYLESRDNEGGSIVTNILNQCMDIRAIDRAAAGGERSLSKLLAQRENPQEGPAEDEGIPGHNPGSANLDPKAPTVLAKLTLGPAYMETELMEDVKAQLEDDDAANPPTAGQSSLVEEFEQRIKREPLDEGPRSEALPFPPSTARDVAMEVQRVKENRDRFRIEGRSGGVGPGLSVTMFTFHNTFDTITCIEFSGDNGLVAAGTSESYIRVWSLDNRILSSPVDHPTYQASSTRRLIGHSAPVYALSFSPSLAFPDPNKATTDGSTNTLPSADSQPRYLLSCSADDTIRLWSLDTWTNLVIYRGHSRPVWDVRFSPQGHYFLSASSDRTARLWSTPNITPLRIFAGHDADVDVVGWHPNNAYIFTGSSGGDRTVRMWDAQRGHAVRIFTGHTGNLTSLACAPNGHMLASADDRGEILLWNLASGRLAKRLRGHGSGGIWSLDWSVESTVLVSGGADGTVRVWDVQPNKETQGKVIGEGGAGTKIDGTSVGGSGGGGASGNASGANSGTAASGSGTSGGTSSGAASGSGNKGKAKKDVVVSPDQISAFPTKKSPVYKVRFTQMNLVVAGGAYLP